MVLLYTPDHATFTAVETAISPAPYDPKFLPPSRHAAVLLRMLADLLDELNELAFFIY